MGERFVQRCTLTSASALGSSPASSAATKPSRSHRVMSRIASAAMGPAACCVMLRLPRLDHPVAVCLWKRVLTESLGSPVNVIDSQSIAFQARSRKGCQFERDPRQLRGEMYNALAEHVTKWLQFAFLAPRSRPRSVLLAPTGALL